jgi:hypothetical protein
LFQKGNKLGHGRPKGSKDFAVELLRAIKYVEKEQKKNLLVHAVEKCYTSEKVLCSMLSKLVPDLSQNEDFLNLKTPIFVTFEALGLRKKPADDTKKGE